MKISDLYGPVELPDDAIVGECCVLGFPKEARLRQAQTSQGAVEAGAPVVVGARCLLCSHVTVYEGARIGDDCLLEDRVRIGYDSRIGSRSRIIYGAYVCDRVEIDADARVAGFVCDASWIGERATVMGQLVHEYTSPHRDWWAPDEPSPVVEHDSVVGYGARVIGGVRIGPRSYVAAGATVTCDVPSRHVVTGVNVQTPAASWPGRRLRELLAHWRGESSPGQ
ncbi:acyltransferase [Sciscionella marina]|uniref:acyltransferase n=1 Tax=Sciscionella marina TaxID=508770 RepID=UPI0009FBA6B2|nr:DapH/DapD/GlmU-related protein [Sciscionella marina]